MNSPPGNSFIKIMDLGIITTLIYHGYKIHGIDKTNIKRVEFIIEKDSKIEELINSYYSGDLMVEPLKFQSIQKNLKSRIYTN